MNIVFGQLSFQHFQNFILECFQENMQTKHYCGILQSIVLVNLSSQSINPVFGFKFPWRRAWQPIPIFLPGKSHGQRNLVARVHSVAELDKTEVTQHVCLGFKLPNLKKKAKSTLTIFKILFSGQKEFNIGTIFQNCSVQHDLRQADTGQWSYLST